METALTSNPAGFDQQQALERTPKSGARREAHGTTSVLPQGSRTFRTERERDLLAAEQGAGRAEGRDE